MKKPFPISIDEELVIWIVKHSEKYRNRSHLVEEAIKDFKKRFEGEHGEEIKEEADKEIVLDEKSLVNLREKPTYDEILRKAYPKKVVKRGERK